MTNDQITVSRELLRQVLTALMSTNQNSPRTASAITALRTAMEQPVQEPVAWRTQSAYPPGGYVIFQQYPQKLADLGEPIEPLFTAPQAQQEKP